MIELRNVTKSYPVKYGSSIVLRDVSLIIPSRSNIAVLGPNGAGKSTFLRLIGGAEAGGQRNHHHRLRDFLAART